MGVKNLESFHVDRAFMGTSGISLSHGYSTPDSLDAQMKHAMIRIADKAYVLTDSSKFGHNCMVSFAKCSDIHLTLTDSGISPKGLQGASKQRRLDICVVGPNGEAGALDVNLYGFAALAKPHDAPPTSIGLTGGRHDLLPPTTSPIAA